MNVLTLQRISYTFDLKTFATRCPHGLPSNPGKGGDRGLSVFLQVGPSTEILHHQASEGFAHVEEQTLEEIHDKILGIAKPVADDGASRKDELALSLMKNCIRRGRPRKQ